MARPPSRIHWHSDSGEAQGNRQRRQTPAQEIKRSVPLINDNSVPVGRDLTQLARQGLLRPMYGRKKELLQLQRILLRKNKNSPLIIGAPGVGKTSLVEGLAQAIVADSVSPDLRSLQIVEIAISNLLADTTMRGSLEARVQTLLAQAAANPNLVLFIDEVHILVNAGSTGAGTLDLANMLKPALSNGSLRVIGATTFDENDRFLKSDPAFERRFEPLVIEEPTEAETIEILMDAKATYEEHHHLQIDPEAIREVVRLSVYHILDRRLPDKAFDLLDSACTILRVPEDGQAKEFASRVIVNVSAVRRTVAEKCRVPVHEMEEGSTARLNGLEAFLNKRILGQSMAMQHIAGALISAFTGLSTPNQPRQVMAFFGASGVGKTATAIALAEYLMNDAQAIIRLDMNQFKEPHSVSRLIGTPPGYIGYTDENTFATQLRRQPYAVVLLDEIEKAHPQVIDAFLNIFDSGRFTDTHGRQIDARQAVFIITSNLFESPASVKEDTYDIHTTTVRSSLSSYFRPEFINRIQEIVLFTELPVEVLAGIVQKEVDELNARMGELNIRVDVPDETARWIAENAYDRNSGARAIARFITREIATPLARLVVQNKSTVKQVFEVRIRKNQLELCNAGN